MNKLSLKFESHSLEARFQEEMCNTYVKIFRSVMAAYVIFIGIPSIIISEAYGNNYDLAIFIIGSISCLSCFGICYTRFSKFLNYIVVLLNFFASIVMGGQLLIAGPQRDKNDEYILFYIGATIVYLYMTVAVICNNFLMSVIQIILSCIWYYIVGQSTKLYAYKYAFGAYQFFAMHFLYLIQRNRRENFLLRENEREWGQVVKKGLTTSLITVKYNKIQNAITLDMINDKARKKLLITTSDEFKEFSREMAVFDSFKDFQEDINQSCFTDKSHKQFHTQLDLNLSKKSQTLENRIIVLIKQSIQKQLNMNSTKQQTQRISIMTNNQVDSSEYQLEDTFCGLIKKKDTASLKKVNIKASTYLNLTNFYCCLVIEEETGEEKAKILQKLNKNIEKNFFSLCLQIGEQLQVMINNKNNSKIIYSCITQCYNLMYNFKAHLHLIRKRTKHKVILPPLKVTTLKDIISRISSQFAQHFDTLEIKYCFENCDQDTKLITNEQVLLQIFFNFVENNANKGYKMHQNKQTKFQISHIKDQSPTFKKLLQTHSQISSPKGEDSAFKDLQMNSCQKLNQNLLESDEILSKDFLEKSKCSEREGTKRSDYLDNLINHKLVKYQKKCEVKMLFNNHTAENTPSFLVLEEDQIHKKCQLVEERKSEIIHDKRVIRVSQSKSRNEMNISNFKCVDFPKDLVKIKFQLIEGTQPFSNIIKIIISDEGRAICYQKMIKILEIVGTKNPAYNSEYFSFQYLGWKINYHLIGQIGPFFNFFLNTEEDQGLELHFYIFQDLEILNKDQQNVTFANQSFQNILSISEKQFFHLNNIDKLKERASRLSFDMSNHILNQFKQSLPLTSTFPNLRIIDKEIEDEQSKKINSKDNINNDKSKRESQFADSTQMISLIYSRDETDERKQQISFPLSVHSVGITK